MNKQEKALLSTQKIEGTLKDFYAEACQREEERDHPCAARSKNHLRVTPEEHSYVYRMPYHDDVDRILCSKAYSRYVDKTQVVYLVENDHISHRSLHVQLVSRYARGIARVLGLNTGLVEAIALGHDVGHPPFGHEGEEYLSALSQEHGAGIFSHSIQSCRLLSEIEPLNLGFAVYDGFLCHDGGLGTGVNTPNWKKNWEEHFHEIDCKKQNSDVNFMPATLEGCLVKICDTISYLCRDLEDAIELGLITRSEIPDIGMGNSSSSILRFLAHDLIATSYEKDYIAISSPVFEAITALREFNFSRIYTHPILKTESKKVENSYRILFTSLLKGWKEDGRQSYLWKHYLHDRKETYIDEVDPVQLVIDYISGMTDGFFCRTLEDYVLPKRILMNEVVR
jgi:dGTPase